MWYIVGYVVVVLIVFTTIIILEKKSTGYIQDHIKISLALFLSMFWCITVPMILIIYLLTKFVEVIDKVVKY